MTTDRRSAPERVPSVSPGRGGHAARARGTLLALLAALSAAGCSTAVPAATEPVHVKVLAINDFHGNLKPTPGIRIKDPADPSRTTLVAAGGSEHLATLLGELRAKNPNHIFVAAGDLVGATPLLSALFRDEPTIESLSLMGLEASAVGNHEFDRGTQELLRLQQGGCDAPGACKGPAPFTGARFTYLAASTVVTATGRTLLPAYHVKRFQGIPVAFVGLTLKATPHDRGAGRCARSRASATRRRPSTRWCPSSGGRVSRRSWCSSTRAAGRRGTSTSARGSAGPSSTSCGSWTRPSTLW